MLKKFLKQKKKEKERKKWDIIDSDVLNIAQKER